MKAQDKENITRWICLWFISVASLLIFTSCEADSDLIEENTFQRVITINENSVLIDSEEIPVINAEARSENYNVLFYDGLIHVFSLEEYYIKTIGVNKAFSPVEEGTMYFIIQDIYEDCPVEITILVTK